MGVLSTLKDEAGLYVFVLFVIFFFSYVLPAIDGGVFIFAEDISEKSEYEVNLTTDARYEIWLVEFIGPEKVNVRVHKGPYVAFNDTFILMHPEGDYLPHHPDFTVRENGTYQVRIQPHNSGKVRIGIRQYPREFLAGIIRRV